jgi:putative DNA methylase
MNSDRRLIEVAFPLKQASLDSVHEKNVRHGHISTLHIWPARRPLAASRAALIATLLPDPGNATKRKEMLEKLGGRLVTKVKKKKLPDGRVEEQISEETEGGILHWGRESSADLDWFREKIREAYGGRAPRVLDPFAGGGAIPLEAMRLGCEVTAVDINPVAWFILKCTLEYPQRLAGQKRRLPDFALQSTEFMESYFKAQGLDGAKLQVQLKELGLDRQTAQPAQQQLTGIHTQVISVEADLAWHVRTWGWWVLQQAKADLAHFYPTIDGKPTVAYLWARTVACKNCRAVVPLLKTRWLCKKDNKRVALTMEPNADKTGVVFGIQQEVPVAKGTTAQKREADKHNGGGTMSHSGVTCPCCGTIIRMEDIRLEGVAGRLGAIMTTVVVDGPHGKEYRLPTENEIRLAAEARSEIAKVFASIPFGLPEELVPKGGSGASRAFSVDGYGFDKWYKLFTQRQLLALGTFVKHTRVVRDAMREQGYTDVWVEAVSAYLAVGIDKLTDYIAALCTWHITGEKMSHVFVRFALPINWDYAELNPLSDSSGNYWACLDWVARVVEANTQAAKKSEEPYALRQSAILEHGLNRYDAIVTDPPYYDAIPYSDLMDFFYVWLRRTLYGLSPEIDTVFAQPISPKWDHEHNDGELIDDSSRFGGDKQQSKANYENGMARVFQACYKALVPDGRLVIVFAHKQPDAWETLVSAIIRAGFVVDGSWPIQTEMGNRTRALSSAALSSSVWLVCKKRPDTARPGWDTRVLEEMQERIIGKLHDFWDAGIRGPDFVWAATGPALEAYSQHPVVKKTNEPGQVLSVSEFLRHVRRIVVDFVVGRVLSHNGGGGPDAVSGLDDVTTYYLLHRCAVWVTTPFSTSFCRH